MIPKLSWDAKAGLLGFAFIPWILLWSLHWAFLPTNGFSQWQIAFQVVGPVWLFISPLISWLLINLTITSIRDAALAAQEKK